MKKILFIILFLLISVDVWSTQTIHRRSEPETLIQNARILADSGTIIDSFFANLNIRTLKAQGIYSSCKFLADANFAVKKDGAGAVSKLYDISGNNNDAVQATGWNQPIWTAGVQNGKNGLVFASGMFLMTAATFPKLANFSVITGAIVNDVTVGQVIHSCCKDNGASNTQWAQFMIKTFGNGDLLGVISDDTNYLISYSGSNVVSNLTPLVLYQSYSAGATTIILRKNGDLVSITDIGTAVSNAGTDYRFAIGKLGEYSTKYFVGKHLFTLILNVVLSTTQRQAMENFINSYYAIY